MTTPTDLAPRHAEPVIEVDRVARRFGSVDALREVSFTVGRAEFVVLTGPSGSGKSTLLNLIAALDSPTSGAISINGHPITRRGHQLNRFRRTEIGIVFQLHNLVPRLSARQNVELALLGSGLHRRHRRRRAADLLAAVGLAAQIDKTPPTMSGGERQRVAIARALANHPQVLLADEPTGSLDDHSANQVINLFEQLRRDEGLTILAVSHDDRLDRRADRIVRLVAGSITDREPPDANEATANEL